MKKLITLLFLVCGLPLASLAQFAPAVKTFSMTTQAISLPGGRSTVAATDTGLTFNVTQNFALRSDNIVTPMSGSSLQGAYFGGFNYTLPALSTKLNNASPNLNGLRFQFYLTASAGVDRITSASGIVQHYAFLAGGGMNYDLNASGSWRLGVEVRYAKLPGYANNTVIAAVGPSFHF